MVHKKIHKASSAAQSISYINCVFFQSDSAKYSKLPWKPTWSVKKIIGADWCLKLNKGNEIFLHPYV